MPVTRPPMVAVVGRKHSGKTTLVVRLAAELVRRGHRVMTIKHGHHTFNLDPSTTDTYRHYHEGLAERVAMAAPDKFALVARWGDALGGPELGPEAIAERYLGDADVVICEGFKQAALPVIEVFREAAHDRPLYVPGEPRAARYLAVITDVADDADPRLTGVPVVAFADAGWLDHLATRIEREVMGRSAPGRSAPAPDVPRHVRPDSVLDGALPGALPGALHGATSGWPNVAWRERLDPAEAAARVLAGVAPLGTEVVALDDAWGRVLAERVVAPLALPPWDASAMDGYAVRAAELAGASPGAPVTLPVDGVVAAGGDAGHPLAVGTARRIMTGAPLPPGADAVVRVEDTDGGRARVAVRAAPAAGRDVRRRGEAVRAGDGVLDPGAALGPAQVGLLAAFGMARVTVRCRPRVAVLGSGDELVPLERAAEALAGRRLVASNNYALAAAVRAAGGTPVDLGVAADTPAAVRERLTAGLDCDLVVTSAGMSAGEFDYMRVALAELGAVASFWTVRMRPGAPMGFGHLVPPPGAGAGVGAVPWVGLPGNPVAALVAFELFVRPAIRRMAGHATVFRRPTPVVLDAPLTVAAGALHLLRVSLVPNAANPDGLPGARLAGPQGSGQLAAMAGADALLVVPEGRTWYDAGETLTALLLGDDGPSAATWPLPPRRPPEPL